MQALANGRAPTAVCLTPSDFDGETRPEQSAVYLRLLRWGSLCTSNRARADLAALSTAARHSGIAFSNDTAIFAGPASLSLSGLEHCRSGTKSGTRYLRGSLRTSRKA